MIISHIVAIAKNNVIGKDNDIPWRIPGELSRFKELTMGKTIIMGRKTFESLPKLLDGRRIIVISNSLKESNDDFILASSVDDALKISKNEEEVFIVGGGQLYKDTLEMADKLYVTILDDKVDGDVFYPEINKQNYKITYEKYVPDANIPYTYYTFEKLKG